MSEAVVADNAVFVSGLRDLANFLDAHPEVPAQGQTYYVYVSTREDLAAIARLGTWEKVYQGDYFVLRKTFSGGFQLDVYTNREHVCRAVVTGKRLVPAVEAAPEHEEDVIEWICEHESLLAEGAQGHAKEGR